MLRNLTVLTSSPSRPTSVAGTHYMLPVDVESIEHTEVRVLHTSRHTIYWTGFVYAEGKPSGFESVRYFAEQLAEGVIAGLECLKGVYLLIVVNKMSGDAYAFVDSSGLFHAFYSSRGVSNSFLSLVSEHQLDFKDLSPQALVQFLHFGHVPFGETFSPEIKRISGEHVVQLSTDGTVKVLRKNGGALSRHAVRDFETQLHRFVSAVAAEKVSIDLTGGIDSRLLAIMCKYFGLGFEVAVSGHDDDEDVLIAHEIAAILERPLHVTHHEIAGFESSLLPLFEVCDGLFNVADAHGPLQHQWERHARGATLMITGAGGELFKEFWWLHDFPFYRRRSANLKRLYSIRIMPVEPRHDYLAEPYAGFSRALRDDYLQTLARFTAEDNTHTYDQIYYYVKMRDVIGRLMSNHAWLLNCYAPYLEPEMASVGYTLPRSARFFNSFHRSMMTQYGPAAARVPTSEGHMSVSSELRPVVLDLSKYVSDRLGRVVRKFGQKVFHRRVMEQGSASVKWIPELQRSPATSRAFETLKDAGILRSDLAISAVEPSYCGTILSLGLLADRINSGGEVTHETHRLKVEMSHWYSANGVSATVKERVKKATAEVRE